MRLFIRLLSCLSIGWVTVVCVYLLLTLPLIFKIVSFIASIYIIAMLAVLLTITEGK